MIYWFKPFWMSSTLDKAKVGMETQFQFPDSDPTQYGWTDGQTDGRTDRWKDDRWIDRWIDEWMD